MSNGEAVTWCWDSHFNVGSSITFFISHITTHSPRPQGTGSPCIVPLVPEFPRLVRMTKNISPFFIGFSLIIGWRSVCPCGSTIHLHWHSWKLSIVMDDRWGLSTHLWFVWYCIEVQIPSLKKPSLHIDSWHSSSSFYLGLGLWRVTCWRVQFNRVPCKFFSSLPPFPFTSPSPPSQLMCCSLVRRFQCIQSITSQWGTQMKLSFGNI